MFPHRINLKKEIFFFSYLFDNQIVGDSNPEAYNRALRSGCRSVEIDCHDGPDGRPIVKHGFTFVKPCLFESIIRLIEPNLFLTSPYVDQRKTRVDFSGFETIKRNKLLFLSLNLHQCSIDFCFLDIP